MATATQLMPSTTTRSIFSPDSPSDSPPPFGASQSSRSSTGPTSTSTTNPSDSLLPPASPYSVGPSPVDSNGTEIEDEPALPAYHGTDDEDEPQSATADTSGSGILSPVSAQDSLSKIDTTVPQAARSGDSDDAPQSVIHAPSGFKQFSEKRSPTSRRRSTPSPTPTRESDATVVSPTTPESHQVPAEDKREQAPPINTSVPAPGSDKGTPRAQTRQELEDEWKRRSRASTSLEDIAEDDDKPENNDSESANEGSTMGQTLEQLNQAHQEVTALKTALTECWTLCNTLAGLSSIHRERIFNYSGKGEIQEQAWRSCWRLCQSLYESRDEDHASQVKPTLELCRDFCQALFEVRHRGEEASDSVLRVSFELNNHLYNTHDRNLPEAFRERTLDFYLTLCHRLMKQRTSLPEETDALLRACWSLAEMLFSLRQNNRDGKPADEELLGSAVQACWDLCDLFREGWTQVRPDRGTPRPSQTTFSSSVYTTTSKAPSTVTTRSGVRSERSSSLSMGDSFHSVKSMPPETPTTIFDDGAELSPEEEQSVPNILVLGPEGGATRTHARWSSNASTLSGYSESIRSTSTSATPRTTAANEDPHLVRLKTLIVKAAMNAGFNRSMPQTLPQFVGGLHAGAFGHAPWQMQLLESYRSLVVTDPTLKVRGAEVRSVRVGAAETARAVQWMERAERFAWLRDLFRLVFGFAPEEAATMGRGVVVQT